MHLTWQPGDPVVQLDFPNPLNVSVQLGDIAYFSNPIPVGIVGNPLSGEQWAATTTPHLTNDQQHVIMIGEIIEIIRWNGTVSSIICNMPQALFNQYFAQINANIVCGDDPGNPSTNSCGLNPIVGSIEDVREMAFSIGNHNTPFSLLGIVIGDPNQDMTYGPCDATIPGKDFIEPGPGGHGGYSTAAQTLQHFINAHGWNLTLTSPYADLKAEAAAQSVTAGYPLGDWHGHRSRSGMPCVCDINETCTGGSFIMFSKDNKVNMSSILGYYAAVEFRNSSQIKSEIFNVGTDFFESSK